MKRARFGFPLLVLGAMVLFAAAAGAQGNCVPIRGTITGLFDIDQMAWVGPVYLVFDDGPVLTGTVVDVGVGANPHPQVPRSGNFSGYEQLTFTVEDLGSFVMSGQFMAMEGSGPFAYGFNETGRIDPDLGTGAFAGMSGRLSIHGSFVAGMDPLPTEERPWMWIAEITGSACGAP